MHIPFQLNATNITENKSPIETTLRAMMLGIRSIPGLASNILMMSMMTVKKKPLTVAAQANTKKYPYSVGMMPHNGFSSRYVCMLMTIAYTMNTAQEKTHAIFHFLEY